MKKTNLITIIAIAATLSLSNLAATLSLSNLASPQSVLAAKSDVCTDPIAVFAADSRTYEINGEKNEYRTFPLVVQEDEPYLAVYFTFSWVGVFSNRSDKHVRTFSDDVAYAYFSIRELAEIDGLRLEWDGVTAKLYAQDSTPIDGKTLVARFTSGSAEYELNGETLQTYWTPFTTFEGEAYLNVSFCNSEIFRVPFGTRTAEIRTLLMLGSYHLNVADLTALTPGLEMEWDGKTVRIYTDGSGYYAEGTSHYLYDLH